jgi:hypothetical protein
MKKTLKIKKYYNYKYLEKFLTVLLNVFYIIKKKPVYFDVHR